MDSAGKGEQLNTNVLKMKKSFSYISPFRKVGEQHEQQATNTGINSGGRAELKVPSDAVSSRGRH